LLGSALAADHKLPQVFKVANRSAAWARPSLSAGWTTSPAT